MIDSGTLLQERFLIEDTIGIGGMGAVYRAVDQKFGSVVAIKETFYGEPHLAEAFEREARLLNGLHHPILPHVSDYFTERGGHFLVMEYIEGDDLSELLKEGRVFPLETVIGWTLELLDGLDYLHSQNPPIIHRDIKPNNLKLTSRGNVVLLDFGMAKETSGNTFGVKSVFGYSRRYSPLEQIEGSGTDTRSDIFSLGATAYHLLTTKAPADVLARASAIVAGRPDPLVSADAVNPAIPPSVARVIERALAINAENRFASANEMSQALATSADIMSPRPNIAAAEIGDEEEFETVSAVRPTGVASTTVAAALAADTNVPEADLNDSGRNQGVNIPIVAVDDLAKGAPAFDARSEFGRRMRGALPAGIPAGRVRGNRNYALWLPVLLLGFALLVFGIYRGVKSDDERNANVQQSPVVSAPEAPSEENIQVAAAEEPEPDAIPDVEAASRQEDDVETNLSSVDNPLDLRKGPIATRADRTPVTKESVRESKKASPTVERPDDSTRETRRASNERTRQTTRPAFQQPRVSSIEAIMTGVPYERRRRWEDDALTEDEIRRRQLRRMRRENRRLQQPY
ncbi:MAG TPA: serine/threonine-protein kinase [Pyrinomonadaceae bacterium]|nr:serine/threonine-protein kinase [Pyrinomonadaceae bacterium]